MSAFTNQFNLPPISYTREVHGTNPGINGAEVEAELDLQWAHVAAPGASIVYHLGGYLVDDITGAVNDNQCGAISISYGCCGPSPTFINGVIDPLFQQAAAQGQSVFVSSGDQGAAGLGYDPNTNSCIVNTTPSVNEMSADPNVTSVGGTQFKPTFANGNDQGYVAESAWNDVSGASGGGASQIFSKPEYQIGAGVPNDSARDVPDVAMMASPNSPGAFFGHDTSGTGEVVCCVGGTSLSAPLWAGFSRVIAQQAGNMRLGNLNPIIYQLANQQYATAGFHDVTIGNNGYNGLPGFTAGPGYDQATGWGTVDFNVFANAVTNLLNPGAATPIPTATPIATPTATPSPTPTPQATGGTLGVPVALNFPVSATGRPGTMKTLVIRNLSRTSPLSVEVGALAAPFAVSGAGSYSIAPQSSISVGIFFSPTNSGTVTQSLQIVSGDPKHPDSTVRVTASARGGKLTMPAAVSLRASTSAVATRTVMLRNSGAGMLAGTVQSFGPNAPFTLLGGPVSFWLASGQSQPVTIQFKPVSEGTVQGSMAVAMAEPVGTASIRVSGSAK
jgi:subtilase family serine protease